jgi:hypothetical protein
MAELTKSDLSKRGNDETLINKFFGQEGLKDTFLHKEGHFKPIAIAFQEGGDQVDAFEDNEPNRLNEALSRVKNILERNNRSDKILFTGKFLNTNKIKTVPLTEMVKTEEFGGQVGGKKINLGIKFEKDFYDSLICELGCSNMNTKYAKDAKKLIQTIGKAKKSGFSQVKAVGGKNKPRPLSYSGGLYVTAGGKKTKKIGSTITDITTTFGGKDEVYLSLKFGDTLTFINSGVGKIFTEKDYKKNFDNYTNSIGKEIFNMFAIDKIEYANVFNNYGKGYKGKKVDVTGKCNKRSIENLLQYAIGYGYWMVHAKNNKLDMFEVTESYMKQSARLTGSVVLHYGGARGSGKRLDIHCESSNYKFMFNLRNKQSGLYPSHIMCDYKKK